MKREREQRREESVPTSLHLFLCREEELRRMRLRHEDGVTFRREFFACSVPLTRLRQETDNHLQRMVETDEEIREEAATYKSSMAAGAAYLKMIDELSSKGLLPRGIMDFYSQCLRINTEIGTHSWQIQKAFGDKKLKEQEVMKGKKEDFVKAIFDREQKNPPSWFGDDKKRWRDFLVDHAVFAAYLNPEVAKIYETRFLTSREENQYLGFTVEHGLPDWFLDASGEMVDPAVVRKEFEEDEEEVLKIVRQREKLKEQSDYLRDIYNQKCARGIARIEEKRRRQLLSVNGFADLISFLGVTEGIYGYRVEPSEISLVTLDQVIDTRLSPEKVRDEVIQDFARKAGTAFSKEVVALWIERQLCDGEIAETARERIGKKLKDVLIPFLEVFGNPEEAKSILVNLRQADKRAFGVVNYEIAPLFEFLSEDERSYLKELVEIYHDESVERLIWDMAEIISLYLREKSEDPNILKQTQIAANHLREFALRWIKKHWQWAYRQMEGCLSGRIPQEITVFPTEEQVIEIKEVETLPINEEVQELESTITQIQRGNLEGWRLLYTFDRKVNDPFPVEIGGETMQEREEAFHQIIARNAIPCSIKPESVIRAFEWLVTVPQEVEQIRMRKEINGETFRKLKRGAVRIFYSLDLASKTIIFFIHQKKAFSYGF